MATLRYRHDNQEQRLILKDRMMIGRLEDNDIWIPDESISRHHALLTREGDLFRLVDQDSQNGIVADGRRVTALTLEDGTRFLLGQIEFTFLKEDYVPESLVSVGPGDVPVARATAEPPPSLAVDLVEVQPAGAAEPIQNQEEAIARLKLAKEKILEEIGKVIIGQRIVLDQILIALFARGHCLLIGVPGLAKTLMVKVLGGSVNLESRRIQFTPDLMPSDITGTDILEEDSTTGKRSFRFHRGPLFTNLLLADEINRTPPKTQAALLEAMQEHRVTISGATYDLPDPFMVLATQNPIEQEGTYPLPEAQLDRFMFCVHIDYPSAQEEQRVLLDTTRDVPTEAHPVLNAAEILQFQRLVRQVPVSQHVASYALALIRATRPNTEGVLDFVKRWIRWGAGTRAGQYLLLSAKAHVLLQGRFSVSCADIRQYALPVLRHRIFCNFAAASEGVSTDQIVGKILEAVKEPKY
jgi:MoxR-like ATPase